MLMLFIINIRDGVFLEKHSYFMTNITHPFCDDHASFIPPPTHGATGIEFTLFPDIPLETVISIGETFPRIILLSYISTVIRGLSQPTVDIVYYESRK
jgi:hypothetical protein